MKLHLTRRLFLAGGAGHLSSMLGLSLGDTPLSTFRREYVLAISPSGKQAVLFRPSPVVQTATINRGGAHIDGAGEGSVLRIVDPVSGKEIQRASVPTSPACEAEWLPDGNEVVFCPSFLPTHDLFRWRLGTSPPVRFGTPADTLYGLKPVGPRTLLCGALDGDGKGALVLLNVDSGEVPRRRSLERGPSWPSVSYDRRRAVFAESVTGGGSRIVLVDAQSLETVLAIPAPSGTKFEQAVFHPSGEFVLVESRASERTSFEVRSVRDGSLLRTLGTQAAKKMWIASGGEIAVQAEEEISGKRSRALLTTIEWNTGKSMHSYPGPWTPIERKNPWTASVLNAGVLTSGHLIASTGIPETFVWRLPSMPDRKGVIPN